MGYDYCIDIHSHRFAAWAASRAASVKGCRFRVEKGREILEGCGFTSNFSGPGSLPVPCQFDDTHRIWRQKAIEIASAKGMNFTHGVAAKLINCYLKSRIVCAGHHEHSRVAVLHPPIDKLLLEELAARSVAGERKRWKRYSAIGWSKFSSDEYEAVIELIRARLNGIPLWMIEEYWIGNQ